MEGLKILLLSREEQLLRSEAWLAYVRHRTLISNYTAGVYAATPPTRGRDEKEILKYHRQRMGKIVKLYPDFPKRADRRGIPGHDTHNPKGA